MIYRLSHSGRVCSGDFKSLQTAGDYNPALESFYEESYEISEG